MDLSVSYNIIVVFLKNPYWFSFSMVSLVIKFMAAPISIRVWGNMMPSMCTTTTGLPGSIYFGQITLPSIKSDNWLPRLSIFLLLGCLKHFSLIRLLYMGTSLIACRRGILTHRSFNSPGSSVSYGVCWLGWINLLGKEGGFTWGLLSSFSSSISLGWDGGWLSGSTLLDLRLISWISTT